MELKMSRADVLPVGYKSETSSDDGFIGAYYRAAEKDFPVKGKYKVLHDGSVEERVEEELKTVEKAYSERFDQMRRWICNEVTEYLYENGGVVNQWPNPDDNILYTYTFNEDNTTKCTASFHYFGDSYSGTKLVSGETVPMKRRSDKPLTLDELPVYSGELPKRHYAVRKIGELEEKFYREYNARLSDAKDDQREMRYKLEILEKEQRENSETLKKSKEKRYSAHPIRRVFGFLLILLILAMVVVPFIRAVTGWPQEYDAFMDHVDENMKSEDVDTTVKIISTTVFTLQLLPNLLVIITDGLRGWEGAGTVYIWVIVLFCAFWVVVGILIIASYCEVFGNGLSRKERRELDQKIKKCKDSKVLLEQKVREAKEENDRAAAAVKAVEATKPEWDKKFAEYQKSDEYKSVEEADRKAQEEAEEQFQKELRIYEEKVYLSREWQLAWREYLKGSRFLTVIK